MFIRTHLSLWINMAKARRVSFHTKCKDKKKYVLLFLFIKLNKVLQEWKKNCFRCFRLFLFPFSARSEKCSDRFLQCLSQVPCGSLIAWIILLVGLGGLTGGLLIGAQKTRDMLDNDQLWVELSYLFKTFIFYSCLLILQSSEVFIGCSRHFVKKLFKSIYRL